MVWISKSGSPDMRQIEMGKSGFISKIRRHPSKHEWPPLCPYKLENCHKKSQFSLKREREKIVCENIQCVNFSHQSHWPQHFGLRYACFTKASSVIFLLKYPFQTFKPRPLRFLFFATGFLGAIFVGSVLAGNFGKSVPSGGAVGQSVPCIVRFSSTMPALCCWTMCFFIVWFCDTMCSTQCVCVLLQPHPVLTNSDMHLYSRSKKGGKFFLKNLWKTIHKDYFVLLMATFLIDFCALAIVNRARADGDD